MVAINPATAALVGAGSSAAAIRQSNARILQAVTQLASGDKITQASDGVAELSIATQLQQQTTGLRTAFQNLAQDSSRFQVADQSLGQQQNILDRLNTLATQANSGALDDTGRAALNTEFQSLTQELDRLGKQTQFGGQNLLDGSFKFNVSQSLGEDAPVEGDTVSVPATTSEALFGGKTPDISTQAKAAKALEALQTAGDRLTQARATVGSGSESVDYASASVESALFNQQAAASDLTDADFAESVTSLAEALTQGNAAIAMDAQTKRLAPSMLKMLVF